MLEIVGSVLAIVILAVIAFPRFFAPPEPKAKRVGSNYWGYYEGTSEHANEDAGQMTVPKPARHNHPVAGSQSYARGPGGKGS
jgi:hypothetical protein